MLLKLRKAENSSWLAAQNSHNGHSGQKMKLGIPSGYIILIKGSGNANIQKQTNRPC